MSLIKDPAQLRYRITINSKQTVKVNGVATTQDVPVATVWAAIKTQRLTEKMANIGNEITNVISFVIRSKQDFSIDNSMTVSRDGTTYQIKYIDPSDTDWKILMCEVITA